MTAIQDCQLFMTVVTSYFWLNGDTNGAVRGHPELLDGVARPESVIVFLGGIFLEAACIVISSQVINSTSLSTVIKELYKLPEIPPDQSNNPRPNQHLPSNR